MSVRFWAGSTVVRRVLWWRVVDVRRWAIVPTGYPRCLRQWRNECVGVKRRVALGDRGVRRLTARATP